MEPLYEFPFPVNVLHTPPISPFYIITLKVLIKNTLDKFLGMV
jgi:hypothetical protein